MDNSALQENAPSEAQLFQAFTPTFGNMSFQVDPVGAQGADVANNYPTIPYISIEAVFAQQMASNPMVSPFNVVSGSNTGQQVIGGQITQRDQNGTSRFQQGYQSR